MQRLFYLAAVTILLTVVFTACSKDDDGCDRPKKMTLTLQISDDPDVAIDMFGVGVMSIDWGDGIDTTYRFEDNFVIFQHHYSGTAATAIVTITGKNIISLYCRRVQLLNLDVSENKALQALYCGGSELTNLDVSKNKALTGLYCGNNYLTNLDVSKNTRLTHLSCEGNQLTSLDMSNNADLSWLQCSANRLMTLNVRDNIKLIALDCSGNSLNSLDVSKNKALQSLDCRNNLFTCEGLNALFESLHSDGGVIFIGDNYGTVDCDRSIATNKNWMVFCN